MCYRTIQRTSGNLTQACRFSPSVSVSCPAKHGNFWKCITVEVSKVLHWIKHILYFRSDLFCVRQRDLLVATFFQLQLIFFSISLICGVHSAVSFNKLSIKSESWKMRRFYLGSKILFWKVNLFDSSQPQTQWRIFWTKLCIWCPSYPTCLLFLCAWWCLCFSHWNSLYRNFYIQCYPLHRH